MKGGRGGDLSTIKALRAAGYNARPIKVVLAGDEEVLHARSSAPDVFMSPRRRVMRRRSTPKPASVDDGIVVRTQRRGPVYAGSPRRGGAVRAMIRKMAGARFWKWRARIIDVQNLTDKEKACKLQCRGHGGRRGVHGRARLRENRH